MTRSSNITYMGGVDEIRGAAALLVLLYHGNQLIGHQFQYGMPFRTTNWGVAGNPFHALLLEGHTAVGLFIVLSGFVFGVGSADKAVRFLPFMRNRVLRIYPLILFLLAIGGGTYRANVAFLPLLQTLLLFNDYPGGLELGSITGMFWAVAVEWKCYLLFPWLHANARRYGARYLLALCGILVLARYCALILNGQYGYLDAYFTVLGRLDQFCIGMLFGYARANGRLRLRGWTFPFAFALCLTAVFLYNRNGGWPARQLWRCAWPTIEALVWGGFITSYLALPARLTLVLRPLRWLGTISYSFYLLHFPVLVTFTGLPLPVRFVPDPTLAAMLNVALILLPILIASATATYWLIERPALKLRSAYTEDALAAPRAAPAA